jgi:DNA-binding IclR family transcriptional regulator
MSKPSRPGPLVPSVAHALAILRLLGTTGEALGVNAIARRLGLGPSTCFNILKTLLAEDMVTFDAETKLYKLGLGTVGISRMALNSDAVVAAARPIMSKLAVKFDAAVALWRPTGRDRVTLVHLAEGEAGTRIHMMVGQRQPIGGGAIGRALMAAAAVPGERLVEVFGAVRWQRPLNFDQYAAQIQDVRKHGYALDIDQFLRGITTAAAAIPGNGDAVYGLSASMFSGRHDKAALRNVGEAVAAAARAVAVQPAGLQEPAG